MGWDGSGNFSRTNGTNSGSETWQDDAAAATKIRADRHDTHDEDLASGIGACLTQNNESKPTADFLPNVDDSYDLGSSSRQWKLAYLQEGIVVNGVYQNSLVTRSNPSDRLIETSEAVEESISITIPSDWNTYDVEATVSCYIEETGTGTGNRGYTLRVREGTSTSGTVIGQIQGLIGNASPDNRAPASFFGFQEGETGSGSQSWSLTSEITGDGGQYSMVAIRWKIKARRVS